MLRRNLKTCHPTFTSARHIKTLHTPVFLGAESFTKQALLEGIRLLDSILNSSYYNKSILYTSKYKSSPQLITSQNQIQLQYVIREYLDRLQAQEASGNEKKFDPVQKLGKIGLQLYLNCHDMNLMPVGTTLTRILMEQYNKCPEKETLEGIQTAINVVRDFLKQNKLLMHDKQTIDTLIEKMANTTQESKTLKRALEAADYRPASEETIRIVKGRRTFDEVEVSKGWRYPAGLLDTNEAYLRSIGLPEKKLIEINEQMIVLLFDGTLRDANRILPTINYASKIQKSVLLVVTGDCLGDALTAITINNNKNRRQGNKTKILIIKYNAAANGNISLQENNDLVKFLQLPNGLGSIYSPEFSSYVPSKMSADVYYGKLDSIKATTGEAFLHNSSGWDDQAPENRFVQLTVTLSVGGHSELEINQRRAHFEHIINNVLCAGLSDGFVPAYGIALAKTIPSIAKLKQAEHNLNIRSALDSCIVALSLPMEIAIKNVYGYSKFETQKIVSETIQSSEFLSANIVPGSESQNVADLGILEPWRKLDQCLLNVSNFIRLLASCGCIVTQVFEKPKRANT